MLELIHNNKDHSNIEQLLPWYVNGTLSDAEHRIVEEHVFHCQACQDEIKFLNSSFDVLNHDDTLISHSEKRFDHLMQRIDRSGNDNDVADADADKHIDRQGWFTKPVYAIAASFIAALLIFNWYLPIDSDSQNRFQTLTSDTPASVTLRVNFKAEADPQSARAILNQIGSGTKIIDNHPDYTVSLPTEIDVLQVAELVKQLNAESSINTANIATEDETSNSQQ